jgi:hypothetical protein
MFNLNDIMFSNVVSGIDLAQYKIKCSKKSVRGISEEDVLHTAKMPAFG